MCGIVAIYNNQIKFDKDMRSKSLSMSKKVRHRGPDWSGIYTSDHAILAHERLSIVDVKSGKQPIISNNDDFLKMGQNKIENLKLNSIKDNLIISDGKRKLKVKTIKVKHGKVDSTCYIIDKKIAYISDISDISKKDYKFFHL